MTPIVRRFAEEYLLDLNPWEAAARCGLDVEEGPRLLRRPSVLRTIELERAKRMNRTQITADEVLLLWYRLARADPRELFQLRRTCCRYCYGIEYGYQFTKNELKRAQFEHRQQMLKVPERQRYAFDDRGGDGFNGTLPPIAECPECWGEGVVSLRLTETNRLSDAAAALLETYEIGRDGSIKVKLRDRGHALDRVANHLGLMTQRHVIDTLDPTKLTNEQLDEAISQLQYLLSGSDGPLIEHEDAPPRRAIDGDTLVGDDGISTFDEDVESDHDPSDRRDPDDDPEPGYDPAYDHDPDDEPTDDFGR